MGLCDKTLGQCTCVAERFGANCAEHTLQLDRLIPPLGLSSGGTPVVARGEYFSASGGLSFCKFEHAGSGSSSIVPASVINSSAVSCVAPAWGTGEVASVRVIGASVSNAQPFRFFIPPALSQLSPYYGPMGGGTLLDVTGSFGWTSVSGGVMPTGLAVAQVRYQHPYNNHRTFCTVR